MAVSTTPSELVCSLNRWATPCFASISENTFELGTRVRRQLDGNNFLLPDNAPALRSLGTLEGRGDRFGLLRLQGLGPQEAAEDVDNNQCQAVPVGLFWCFAFEVDQVGLPPLIKLRAAYLSFLSLERARWPVPWSRCAQIRPPL